MNSLLIYSSTDGQTKKICEEIKAHSVNEKTSKITSIEEVTRLNLQDFDQIIIGASIRYGNHNKKVHEFVEKNKDILSSKKNAFFSVNVVARKPEKGEPNTNPYVQKFLKKTKWRPKKLGVFAGKIDYPSLNFINRNVIRLIMFITRGPTDTRNIYEFTNWESVKSFTKELDEM